MVGQAKGRVTVSQLCDSLTSIKFKILIVWGDVLAVRVRVRQGYSFHTPHCTGQVINHSRMQH